VTKKIDFLRGFIEYLDRSEVPDEFALWSAISGVSCAMGRKVWFDRGIYTLYPNFYIILVAESGRQHKSTAINNMGKIMKSLNPKPNIVSQMLTPIGLIDAMMSTTKIEGKKKVKDNSKCEAFVLCDELVVFLNRQTYETGLGAMMIPLFDCDPDFGYRTKARGLESILNSQLGMLSASTVHSIKVAIPEDAIHIGLAARIVFVYCSDIPPPVSKPSRDDELFEHLCKELQEIHELRGQVEVTEEAEEFYDHAYKIHHATSPLYLDKNTAGYASRKFNYAFNIALILSVVESKRLFVDTRHLEGALAILAKNEMSMGHVIQLITTTEQGLMLEHVYKKIAQTTRGISRTNLMRQVSHKLDSKKLTEVLETLRGSGKIIVTTQGRGQWYQAVGGPRV